MATYIQNFVTPCAVPGAVHLPGPHLVKALAHVKAQVVKAGFNADYGLFAGTAEGGLAFPRPGAGAAVDSPHALLHFLGLVFGKALYEVCRTYFVLQGVPSTLLAWQILRLGKGSSNLSHTDWEHICSRCVAVKGNLCLYSIHALRVITLVA